MMTDEEKKQQHLCSPERFFREFRPAIDRISLISDFLEAAIQTQDDDNLDDTLFLGSGYGYCQAHLPLLIVLLRQEWHTQHESLVDIIAEFKSDTAIEVLDWAAQIRLAYLDYDDSKALARKAIYALAKIPSHEALEKLESIAQSEEIERSSWAKHKLGQLESPKG